jgi:hypothetical protein
LEAECLQLRSRLRRRPDSREAIAWLHRIEVAEARLARIRVLTAPAAEPRRSFLFFRRRRDSRRTPVDKADDAIGVARAEASFRNHGRLGGFF